MPGIVQSVTEVSMGLFSVTRPDPTRQIFDPTRANQLIVTPDVEFWKQSKEEKKRRSYGNFKYCELDTAMVNTDKFGSLLAIKFSRRQK